MSSLWGDLNLEKINTPVNILEEQARFLKAETGKIVCAEITRNVVSESASYDTSELSKKRIIFKAF